MSIQDRVMTVDEAVSWRDGLRKSGLRLVVTNGCFDILHRGHVDYLDRAKALGDKLLVLVNSDASVRSLKGPERPVNPESDRAFVIASLRSVDAAVVFDGTRCDRELALLSPDVYAKAGDYTLDKLDPSERKSLEECGAKIEFMPFVAGRSTTGILNRIRHNAKQ
ncbi:MAG: adenylyltransferase/cytidyltransferase family protein [Victivallaceae bacterium]|nr:adenylyltransferase/cytidyltransferase family protein [Victivallaceae bacterium]